jgi:hypothetical protein
MENAEESALAAVARRDNGVPQIDLQKSEDDETGPIRSRECEHGGGDGEKPFPCSTSESIGTVSSQKSIKKKKSMKQIGRVMPYTMA